MGFEVSKIREQELGGRLKIDIILEDARVLIGEKGATLAMFQHLVRRIVSKKGNARQHNSIGLKQAKLAKSGVPDPLGYPSGGLEFLDTQSTQMSESAPQIVDIDINGYKRMREDVLRDFAIGVAGSVRTKRRAVELDPMPPFDRRIVHIALSTFSDITTESVGEGENRYIVVRPYP